MEYEEGHGVRANVGNSEGSVMARPIEATPILKGKDAEAFLRRMETVVVTKERVAFLKTAALQSKKAERDR
jgi:hypothetical protein